MQNRNMERIGKGKTSALKPKRYLLEAGKRSELTGAVADFKLPLAVPFES